MQRIERAHFWKAIYQLRICNLHTWSVKKTSELKDDLNIVFEIR